MVMDVERLGDLPPERRRGLLERDAGVGEVLEDARGVVERVRVDGDAALREFTREFDEVDPDRLEVTDEAAAAWERLDGAVRSAVETALENVRAFHERQRREDWRVETRGRELGRRFAPVERAGVYVPGGRAAYPSSAVMGVVPARVAGVESVAVATPPAEEVSDVTLGAIHAAGADEVYAVGGAQAIGALAYGTETVSAVDVVAGPGSRWVTAAKRVVQGDVGVDLLAGPSEVLVLADGDADPALVAAELLAQAEHDPAASVVAVTDDRGLAAAVDAAVERQLPARERRTVIEQAIAGPGSGLLVADSMAAAAEFAEAYAPEHLAIHAAEAEALLEAVPSAGSAFLGPQTPVAAGDYASGTNHVLPTGGGARFAGGLSVDTFLRATTIQRLDREALADLRAAIETLAEAEGLEAHAASVRARFEDAGAAAREVEDAGSDVDGTGSPD